MTDSSDPTAPKSSRRRSARQPATIDVKPTVLDEGTAPVASTGPTEATTGIEPSTPSDDGLAARDPAAAADVATSAATTAPATTLEDAASPDVLTDREASVDAGAGVDSITQPASFDDPRAEIPAADGGLAANHPPEDRSPNGFPGDDLPRDVPPSDPFPGDRPPAAGGFGRLVAAGLVGGLLGGGIVLGVQAVVPFAHEDRRIDALEGRLNALPTTPSGDLTNRLVRLERTRAADRESLTTLQTGVQQLQTRLDELQNRPAPAAANPADAAALGDLGGRLSALDSQMQSGAQTGRDAVQALEKRLGDATGDLARRLDEQTRQVMGQVAGQVTGLEQRLDQRLGQQLGQWDQRLGQLDGRLGRLDERLGGIDQRTGQQDTRLAALAQQATEGAASTARAGVAVTLSGRLSDALRDGKPYGPLLEALRKAGIDPARLAPLEPFAATGAPTAATLAAAFKPVGDAIIRESRSGAEGWNDRILRMVDRVVTVRPVNDSGSTGVPSVVARIGAALDAGDVQGALAAWETLPEPARRLSDSWARQARERVAADVASGAIASDALATLTRTVQ